MLRIFLDFETYYDKSYSLRHLSPVEYILHPQFEVLGCAVAVDHEASFLLPRNEIEGFLREIKQTYCVITHNALFDACILAYHHDINPDGLLCTLSMSRALILARRYPMGYYPLRTCSSIFTCRRSRTSSPTDGGQALARP